MHSAGSCTVRAHAQCGLMHSVRAWAQVNEEKAGAGGCRRRRPTTKDVVLEERKDMLIEFQRLEEAIVEDMPRDLEGPTDDLVEVGLLETNRRVVRGVPGIEQPVFDEEWAAAAAASRKRRAVRQPSGSDGEDSESEEKKRAAAKARFGSLRTATDEELRRALDGSLAVKDITRPPGDYEEGAAEWRLDAKKGLVLEAKAKHCRSFDEWDENFTVLACKAPEDARDLLLQFRKWMRLMSIDYSWDHLRKFYDHLCVRMEKEASTTFELVSYTAHWEMYKRDKGIKEKGYGGGGGGSSSSWNAVGTGSRYSKKPRVSDPEQPDASVVKPDKPGSLTTASSKETDEPYVVENYVGDEHAEAMTAELAKEMATGRIFDARDWLPRGVSALGMVERLRKGKLKYRPVWDYSRPSFVGVNDWIDLQKDEFTTVKDAYALLRPGMYMVKVDLEEAYRSLPVAS
ncbi:hypothetical protein CYMTET_34286 [Cymbomonas tetramitiformis]|uniref:Uncharacterized protein n=1 Tax=Cymbomonas tetramitiformis TaxID=36881 RepID=A0AAE0FBD0_9CHLO|nr:hypothetical protein CYMTET_34286 [Cymbomonas tetramitiformis]